MEKNESEQVSIQSLKEKEAKLRACLTKHGCIGVGCPEGRNPVKCHIRLEATRSKIESVQQTIIPAGSEAWTGEYSVKSANNIKR